MSGVSEAYVCAVQAIAAVAGVTPLPKGINTVTAGDWTLVLNASSEPERVADRDDPLGPYELMATNNRYLAFAVMDPAGGATGGISEAQFINEMKELAGERAK